MNRRSGRIGIVAVVLLLLSTIPARGADTPPDAGMLFRAALTRWIDLYEPPAGASPRTVSARVHIVKAVGLVPIVLGAGAEVSYQAPDRLRVGAVVSGQHYAAGRDGQQLWVHEPDKHFALLGKNGVARFAADPKELDKTVLPPFQLPIPRLQLKLLPLLMQAELAPAEQIDGEDCHVIRLEILPQAAELLHLHGGQLTLWLRKSDSLPARIVYVNGDQFDVRIDLSEVKVSEPWPAERWKLAAGTDVPQIVALSHLDNFLDIAPSLLDQNIPTLGPATGRREVIAQRGKGRLELIDGTRVLFLKGSPEEMGRQHGQLLAPQIRDVCQHILYGVGVGSSFAKGKWFIGEIESAQARLLPFMDTRYLRELDAIAAAVNLHPQEARFANFFPELFHCSGFALMGSATADGHIYHGRVLDYLRGVGLEQNAVVIVHQPDYGNAWINLTYAGFVGSVSAMNEKGISIGEMGGGGYGQWDGKPMAHLVREVMEKASTLDEAVAIMKNAPRTCSYYYVIADGRNRSAVGIAATPDSFETIRPGESHPLLPHPQKDTVILSAGERYETLAGRIQAGLGHFDSATAQALMNRPVCMTSNIQSVLFRPDTLDLWVANADSKNVASHTRYTHYNLKDLLKPKTDSGF